METIDFVEDYLVIYIQTIETSKTKFSTRATATQNWQ